MTKTDHPRRKKTARQRAEEALGIAQRRVDTLDKQRKRLQGQVNQVVRELEEARTRLDYARKDPALTEGTSATNTTTTVSTSSSTDQAGANA